jgi:4-hydroxy-2-oxoheptanedioate aldolase
MGGTTQEYFAKANANTLVCLMLEEVVAIDNVAGICEVKGVDVLFIGSGDLSQSMGHPGQQSHPEVLKVMEKGVKVIRDAGVAAGVSCPDALVPKFLDLGVQYFHSNVSSLLQSAGQTYLETVRQAAGSNK